MADSLYIYNIPWVKTFFKTSIAFSKHFKDKRQRLNFIAFLTSLSLTGSPLLSDVAQVISKDKHCSRSLSHFFNHTVWNPQYFEKQRTVLCLKHLLPNCQAVAIDSTALAKTGRHFENEGAVYDSRINGLTDGFPLLIATGITEENHYSPLSFLRYCHQDLAKRTENQIKERFIKQLLALFARQPKMPVFVGDSGFSRKNIVFLFLNQGIPFVLKTTKRKVILKSSKKTLTSKLSSGAYEDVQIATQNWENIHCNLVVGPYDQEKGERRVFITNLSLKDYSKNAILKFYEQRWFVEESIKELKQQFGLEGFRVRGWEASERFLTLLFLACSLTHLALKKHNAWIQYVLPYLLAGIQENFCFSIYHCRKMLLKLLFCGQGVFPSNSCLIETANSP